MMKPAQPIGDHPKPIPPMNIYIYIYNPCSDDEDRASVSDKVLVLFSACSCALHVLKV